MYVLLSHLHEGDECSMHGKRRSPNRTLVGNSVGISRSGWDYNNKMYLREIEPEIVLLVAYDRDRWQARMNINMKFRCP
jgi:hypothetical protein